MWDSQVEIKLQLKQGAKCPAQADWRRAVGRCDTRSIRYSLLISLFGHASYKGIPSSRLYASTIPSLVLQNPTSCFDRSAQPPHQQPQHICHSHRRDPERCPSPLHFSHSHLPRSWSLHDFLVLQRKPRHNLHLSTCHQPLQQEQRAPPCRWLVLASSLNPALHYPTFP